jgi:hypothetical protein
MHFFAAAAISGLDDQRLHEQRSIEIWKNNTLGVSLSNSWEELRPSAMASNEDDVVLLFG